MAARQTPQVTHTPGKVQCREWLGREYYAQIYTEVQVARLMIAREYAQDKATQAEGERLIAESVEVRAELEVARKQRFVTCPQGGPGTPLTPAELAAFKRMQDLNRAVQMIETRYISLLESRPQTPRAIAARAVAGDDQDQFDVGVELDKLELYEDTTFTAVAGFIRFIREVEGSFTDAEKPFTGVARDFIALTATFEAHLRQVACTAAESSFACLTHSVEAGGGQVTEAQALAARAAFQHIWGSIDVFGNIDWASQEGRW